MADAATFADFNALLQAIGTSSCPAVQQILSRNPELVKLQVWHGMTALHRACLFGDYNVILLLLRAGADPNAPTANQETPTLFSCKRGITPVLHLMLEFGGDVTKVDNQGRGAMMHAAESGTVANLHYLNTVCNLSFNVFDSKRQSPIHTVCQFGHFEAFKYLTRKDRCDLRTVNIDGDTPLHILSREGHSHLCWLLLSILGSGALRIKNNAGYTPTDLAEQRDKMGHREITPVFQYYSKQPGDVRPQGPVLYWYWLLLMPTVVYATAVVISHYVPLRLHAVTIIVGLGYILVVQKKQLHRLQHVCRWPNPIYTGIFGAGLLHTMICLYMVLLPDIMEWTILTILTPVLTILLLLLYWKVLTLDPGTVTRNDYDESSNRELRIEDLCSPSRKIQDFCADCEIVRPKYTKHCKLCNRCYDHMDHHCLFLNRCVARINQLYFVWFIFVCLVCMCLFVIISIKHCYTQYSIQTLILHHVWIASLVIMNSCSILWGVNLIKNQFIVIANDCTNYFRPRGFNELLTTNEKWLNVLYFMIGRKPYIRNPIHKQFLNV